MARRNGRSVRFPFSLAYESNDILVATLRMMLAQPERYQEPLSASSRGLDPRGRELRREWGLPLCVAKAIREFELGVDHGPDWPWMAGAEYVEHPDGRREVVEPPMIMGECANPRCPDCR